MLNILCSHCLNCGEVKYDGFYCDITGYLETKTTAEGCKDFKSEHGSEWIPCSSRMPDPDIDVLAFFPRWKDQWNSGIVLAKFVGTVWYICGEFNPGRNEITHWQPLPDPPASNV